MRTRLLIATLAICACPAEDPVEGNDSTSTDGSTSTAATMTTTMSTTTSPTTTDTSTTVEPSTGPAESSGPSDSSGPADSSGSSGEPGACDFPTAVADAIADAEDPVDCGVLTAADPLMAWEDARSCARDAQLSQAPFSLMWQFDDGGTIRDRAYASNGFSMPLMYFEDDAATGTTSISVVTCTGTGNPPKCEVAVGELCLECLEPTVAVELCE